MKNFVSTVSILSLVIIIGCSKSRIDATVFTNCILTGNVETVNNQPGVLHYTKSIGNLMLADYRYILISEDHVLPLLVCKLPVNQKELGKDQSVAVIFSGRIELLPPNIDANSRNLELTSLKEISKSSF